MMDEILEYLESCAGRDKRGKDAHDADMKAPPPPTLEERCRYNADLGGIGAVFSPDDEGVMRVSKIKENGAAGLNGNVHIGDALHTVNGKDVYKWSAEKVSNLIVGKIGTEVALELVGLDGKQKTVKLVRTRPNEATNTKTKSNFNSNSNNNNASSSSSSQERKKHEMAPNKQSSQPPIILGNASSEKPSSTPILLGNSADYLPLLPTTTATPPATPPQSSQSGRTPKVDTSIASASSEQTLALEAQIQDIRKLIQAHKAELRSMQSEGRPAIEIDQFKETMALEMKMLDHRQKELDIVMGHASPDIRNSSSNSNSAMNSSETRPRSRSRRERIEALRKENEKNSNLPSRPLSTPLTAAPVSRISDDDNEERVRKQGLVMRSADDAAADIRGFWVVIRGDKMLFFEAAQDRIPSQASFLANAKFTSIGNVNGYYGVRVDTVEEPPFWLWLQTEHDVHEWIRVAKESQ